MQCERWLPGLASGELSGAFGGARDLTADATDASVIVVVEAGAPRVVAGADAAIEPVAAIDPTRRYARVGGDGPALAGNVEAALGRAGAAVAAEVVGVCQRALDMTVAYVSERRQFGVPVGSFQAVAHRCAQMLLHTPRAPARRPTSPRGRPTRRPSAWPRRSALHARQPARPASK